MRNGTLALAAAAVLASGCLGGDAASFRERAEEICSDLTTKARPIRARLQSEVRATPTDSEAIRRHYAELLSLTRSALDGLRSLELSEGDPEEYQAVLDAQHRIVVRVEAGVEDFIILLDQQVRAQARSAEITRARRVEDVERLGERYPSLAALARDMRAARAATVAELPPERVTRAYLDAQLEATESVQLLSRRIERRQRAIEAESRRLERRLSKFGVEGCEATA